MRIRATCDGDISNMAASLNEYDFEPGRCQTDNVRFAPRADTSGAHLL